MTTPVYEQLNAIQYDGTNGSAIAALITNGSVTTDTGTLLVIEDGGSEYSADLNDWFVIKSFAGTDYDVWNKPVYVGNSTVYAAKFNNV